MKKNKNKLMRVYLMGSLANAEIPIIGNKIRALGIEATNTNIRMILTTTSHTSNYLTVKRY